MESSEENEKFEPLSPELEELGKEIVDAAYKVHSKLEPGLLERIYEVNYQRKELIVKDRLIYQ